MVFYLEDELSAAVANLANRADHRQAFENIAVARREGYHVILGSINVITALKTSPALSLLAKAMFTRISEEDAQIGVLRTLVEKYVSVTAEFTVAAPFSINVSLSSLAKLDSIRPTRLIGENLDDSKFYRFLGQSYIAGFLKSGLPIACEPIPGGGADTPKVYAYYKPQAGFTMAIVDSDKLCPDDALGSVPKNLRKADEGTAGFGRAVVLKTKGIENVIPISLYKKALETGWSCELGLAGLNALHKGPSEIRFFSDIKNGLLQHKVLSWTSGSPRKLFWQPRYKNVRSSFGAVDQRCDKVQKCDTANDCKCWVVKRAGAGALTQAVVATSQIKPVQVWRELDEDLKAEWVRVGKIVVSWCCGLPPVAGP
jgi:hypothetical protein